jgi:putative ABC transport system permease protein
LLSGAVLLLRSLNKIERQDIGVNSAHVLTVPLSLPLRGFGTKQKCMDFFLRVADALRGIPEVASVVVADSLPPSGSRSHWYSSMAVAGKPPLRSEGIVRERAVTVDYFNTLGVPIIRGRGFSDADARSKDHVTIISQQLAASLFPDEDPLGQQIQPEKDEAFYGVIGIAGEVRNDGLTGPILPQSYKLLRAIPEDWDNMLSGVLIIRSALPIKTAAPWIRQRIEEVDPLIPIEVQSMDLRSPSLPPVRVLRRRCLDVLQQRDCSWLQSDCTV